MLQYGIAFACALLLLWKNPRFTMSLLTLSNTSPSQRFPRRSLLRIECLEKGASKICVIAEREEISKNVFEESILI